MLKGIDISAWQANLNAGTINADFVIIKATEGVGYTSPTCDKHYQQAKAAGKLRGVYHFARNTSNTAEAEAQYFVDRVKGYVKDAMLILDWEDSNTSDVAWAKRWLDKVHELTGVKPLIYMSSSVMNSHDWSSVANADYGLWVAQYRDMAADFNYNMALAGPAPVAKWWKFYAMWQWTSSGRLDGYDGNLDCNQFYGDAAAWQAYANASSVPTPTPPPAPAPAPAPAPSPQLGVYVVKPGDNLSAIAAKYGTSWQYLAAINGLANPNYIQVGQVLKVPASGAPAPKSYTVKRGDTLSGIAAANGTTWQTLASINGLANPNLIYPGQVLRLP
mgnify:CR=1 FL=1